jgi:hypothetical protein
MIAHTVLTGYSNGQFAPRRVLVCLPFTVLAALRGRGAAQSGHTAVAWHDWVLTGTSPRSSAPLRSTHAVPRPSQVGAGRWGVGASGNMWQRTAPSSGSVYKGTHGGCSRGTHRVLTGYSRAAHRTVEMAKYVLVLSGSGSTRRSIAPRRALWCVGSLTLRYSTGTHRGLRTPSSTECKVEHSSVLRADHGCCLVSHYRTRAVRLGACAAPTPAPTGTPTNPGDTNPPTRAPTSSAPTLSPTLSPTFPGGARCAQSMPLNPLPALCHGTDRAVLAGTPTVPLCGRFGKAIPRHSARRARRRGVGSGVLLNGSPWLTWTGALTDTRILHGAGGR